MLVVDVAGDAYPSIGHASWDGLHLADFVMPYFLLICGISAALSPANWLGLCLRNFGSVGVCWCYRCRFVRDNQHQCQRYVPCSAWPAQLLVLVELFFGNAFLHLFASSNEGELPLPRIQSTGKNRDCT